jgi:hypothetical protein
VSAWTILKYTDDSNPYTQGHMHRAFRLGWEAADDGLDEREAQERAGRSMLNRMTTRAWWRGFRTQRGEY